MARGRPIRGPPLAASGDREAGAGLDALFAGMPRARRLAGRSRPCWPSPPPRCSRPAGGGRRAHERAVATAARRHPAVGRASRRTIGLWGDGRRRRGPRIGVRRPRAGRPSTDDELSCPRPRRARRRARRRAAVHLGLVMRLRPALAPVVLDLVGARPDPALAFVRGDAYRLVGPRDRGAPGLRRGRATAGRRRPGRRVENASGRADGTAHDPSSPTTGRRPPRPRRPRHPTHKEPPRDRTHPRPHQARWRAARS